jgi:molybdopterin molybdotransferase
VGIVATGDELVGVEERPEAWQIRNSNGYALEALVAGAGGVGVRLGVARDLKEEVRARILEARGCDLMILSGGVSMGKYDLVEEVLAEFGAEFLFTGVRMQPGRPVAFGRFPEGGYFFGLPGNPVSTQVTFHCFVEAMVRALGGGGVVGPRFALARLGEDVAGKVGLMRVLPGRLVADRVGAEVRVVGWQGSGDLGANARANCYVVLAEDREGFREGDLVSVLLR